MASPLLAGEATHTLTLTMGLLSWFTSLGSWFLLHQTTGHQYSPFFLFFFYDSIGFPIFVRAEENKPVLDNINNDCISLKEKCQGKCKRREEKESWEDEMWVVAALNRVVREASSRRCHWSKGSKEVKE